jgi:hypothetical protein
MAHKQPHAAHAFQLIPDFLPYRNVRFHSSTGASLHAAGEYGWAMAAPMSRASLPQFDALRRSAIRDADQAFRHDNSGCSLYSADSSAAASLGDHRPTL